MKKEYIQPKQRVVVLRHRTTLLAGSFVRSLRTNMDNDDDEFIYEGGDYEDAITTKGGVW